MQTLVKQLAGGANEWPAGDVLAVSRLLADKQDARGLCPFTEYSLGGILIEVASLAAF